MIIQVSKDSDFPIENIPFGIISTAADPNPRPATAIGDYALDLSKIAHLFNGPILKSKAETVFRVVIYFLNNIKKNLNAFMAMGRSAWREARGLLQKLINGSDPRLSSNDSLLKAALIPLNQVKYHMPAEIGDYTDFYSSKEHATNVGTMFR